MTCHLEEHLRGVTDRGGKCLVPYLVAGAPGWQEYVHAAVVGGADAVEVGIPFSDPVMDGPTIQQASDAALEAGATPDAILADLADLTVELQAGSFESLAPVPIVVMTYYNIAYHMGLDRFASRLLDTGVSGVILADLPLRESAPWRQAVQVAGAQEARTQGARTREATAQEVSVQSASLATIFLAAPTTPLKTRMQIAEHSSGFIYAVGLLGVTGERAELASTAETIAAQMKEVSSQPVLVGVGVSTPDQAAQASHFCDGVVVGSALVRQVLEGASPDQLADSVAEFRKGLPRG